MSSRNRASCGGGLPAASRDMLLLSLDGRLRGRALLRSQGVYCPQEEDHERFEGPPEDGSAARSPLVGAGREWARALFPLPPPLPYSSRAIGILLHPHQS